MLKACASKISRKNHRQSPWGHPGAKKPEERRKLPNFFKVFEGCQQIDLLLQNSSFSYVSTLDLSDLATIRRWPTHYYPSLKPMLHSDEALETMLKYQESSNALGVRSGAVG